MTSTENSTHSWSLRGGSYVSLTLHSIAFQSHDKYPHVPTNCHPTSIQSLNLHIILKTLSLLTFLSRYQSPCEALLCWTNHCHLGPAWWSHADCYCCCLWCRCLVLNPPRNKRWMAGTDLHSQGHSFASSCLTPAGHLVKCGELGHLLSWLLCRHLYLVLSKYNHHVAPGLQPQESPLD